LLLACSDKHTWQKLLSLRFVRHRELESRFQKEYLSRFAKPNRGALSQVLVALLVIGTYDTLAHLGVSQSSMTASWIIRAVALLLGLVWYLLYFTSIFAAKRISSATMDALNCVVRLPLQSRVWLKALFLAVYVRRCLR
jgi:hypothetical protein